MVFSSGNLSLSAPSSVPEEQAINHDNSAQVDCVRKSVVATISEVSAHCMQTLLQHAKHHPVETTIEMGALGLSSYSLWHYPFLSTVASIGMMSYFYKNSKFFSYLSEMYQFIDNPPDIWGGRVSAPVDPENVSLLQTLKKVSINCCRTFKHIASMPKSFAFQFTALGLGLYGLGLCSAFKWPFFSTLACFSIIAYQCRMSIIEKIFPDVELRTRLQSAIQEQLSQVSSHEPLRTFESEHSSNEKAASTHLYLDLYESEVRPLLVPNTLFSAETKTDENHYDKLIAEIQEETFYAATYGWIWSNGTNQTTLQLDAVKTKKMIEETHMYGEWIGSQGAKGNCLVAHVMEGNSIDQALELRRQMRNPVLLNLVFSNHGSSPSDLGTLFMHRSLPYPNELPLRSNFIRAIHNNFKIVDTSHKFLQPLPDFGCIYTSNVQFFRQRREEGFAFFDGTEKPILDIAVISYAPFSKDDQLSSASYKDGVKRKIRQVLRTAIKMQHDSIVLGGFGAKLYQEDHKCFAACFREVLKEKEFTGANTGSLKEVFFAIANDWRNPNVFSDFSDILIKGKSCVIS